MKKIAFGIIALCLISTVAVTAEWDTLAGNRYVLAAIDGKAPTFESEIAIAFDADGMASGTVCNNFRGKATLTDGIIRLEQILSTRKICIAGGLSDLESTMFAMLSRGAALIPTSDGFDLRRDGTILTFVQKADEATNASTASDVSLASLSGRRFVLRSVNGDDFVMNEGRQPEIGFEDSRVFGIICNSFNGPAEIANSRLTVTNAASTMKLCINRTLMDLEQKLYRQLADGMAIRLDNSDLILRGNGLELVFAEKAGE